MCFWREEEGSRNNHWAVAVDQVAALRWAIVIHILSSCVLYELVMFVL